MSAKKTSHNKSVVGTISPKALRAEVGPNIAASILKHMTKGDKLLIPNLEDLRRGDIILSKSVHRKNHKAPVELAQRNLKSRSFSDEASSWCHAMIYIGNLFVAESQIYDGTNSLLGGLQALSITKYSHKSEFIIRRHKEIAKAGDGAAQYAAINCLVRGRSYPYARSIWEAVMDVSVGKKLDRAANCSEFALECLAIGGAMMTADYENVKERNERYYPADFYMSSELQSVEMTYLELTDH